MEGISTQDMLAIAKGYFKQQGFKTDDSVEGTVKNLLMAMESGNIDRMLKAICDEASSNVTIVRRQKVQPEIFTK